MRRLTYLSGSSVQKLSRIEKRSSDKSPAAREIPVCCQQYQQRLDAAAEQVRLIRENGEPQEAEQGLGEVEMREQDSVQTKLQELTQQMVHVVQACNEEKGLIEDEIIAVRHDLELLEVQICTQKAQIEGAVSGVGGQMLIQQAMIHEMRQGRFQQDQVIRIQIDVLRWRNIMSMKIL